MGRVIRPVMALLLALFVRPGPAYEPAAPRPAGRPGGDAEWYAPRAEDFRPYYDRDAANQRKETWEQYWGWVQSFYRGNLLAQGWSDRAAWLVEVVRSDVERTRLRTGLNAMGREICAEWAKDYDVRKVNSADLQSWGKMLEKARGVDDGNGAALHRTLDEIREDHGRKLGRAASSR